MELGFETIGNATLVCHDNGPVLVTDPWTTGTAYFGSWGLSHAIPDDVMASIRACRYVWVSHGHPDHMSPRSLDSLSHAEILLPDHVSGLIREGLKERGLKVRVLEDCRWIQLSERIRVMSIADYIQDAILLVDLDGRLIVNLNDADDNGWGPLVKRIIRGYDA
jgi:glyoxylase-like metal-dependent hydrolase (beta-lactamase superfamily II)